MDTQSTTVDIKFTLTATEATKLILHVGNYTETINITDEYNFHLKYNTVESESAIRIELNGMTDENPDATVKISNIIINDIVSDRYILYSKYEPDYPKIWYAQQNETPKQILMGVDTLGWNGTWELIFDVPAFAWIHKINNYGWLYK